MVFGFECNPHFDYTNKFIFCVSNTRTCIIYFDMDKILVQILYYFRDFMSFMLIIDTFILLSIVLFLVDCVEKISISF